ncbi:transcription cofactor HES-6-like [Cetorhinus maximus]|uniref:transcription cofactor HES-6-like n=1 Tax=Carcharodon carcharias TaxID=13397 RepID=UPI001B7F0317|nr:transcription cofactor HES-6-like [Carcharodon carcharias]
MTATTFSNNVEKLSNAKEERKLRKPLIERKRRERINNCLDQLKETVVGAFRLDQSKLEKADILEMTVKHLQNVQNSRMIADSKIGLEAQQRYSAGYIQCMHEVHNLLLTCDWMDKTVGARLLNHLLKSLPRSSEDSRQPRLKTPTVNLQPAQTQLSSVTHGNMPSVNAASSGAVDSFPRSSPDQICNPGFKACGKNAEQFPVPTANLQQPASSPTQQLQEDLSFMHHPSAASSDVWRPW